MPWQVRALLSQSPNAPDTAQELSTSTNYQPSRCILPVSYTAQLRRAHPSPTTAARTPTCMRRQTR
eukprot:13884324-Alexandrium_andersonii.AAC.1